MLVNEKKKPINNKSALVNELEHPLIAPGVTVLKPMSELFADAVDYQHYRLIKRSARYNDNVANELKKMTKETTVQVKHLTFTGRGSVSMIASLQAFKADCDAYNINEGAAMWPFKHYLSGLVETIINARVVLPTQNGMHRKDGQHRIPLLSATS